MGKTGKVSGKFIIAKKSFSFTAAVYTQDAAYHATSSVKYGKKTYPLVIAVGRDAETGKAFAEIAVINGKKTELVELAK